MTHPRKLTVHLILIAALVAPALASRRTEAGLTLLEAPAARPAALGEAFTAASNDVSAFFYNPSALSTLEKNHASVLFQRGFADDSFGQFNIGFPSQHGGIGFSAGYYQGGTIDYFDGTQERTVVAQQDVVAGLGFARSWRQFSAGVTGKYISSTLVETDRATALALDMGLGLQIGKRLRLGGAVQNIGGTLTYNESGDSLPRRARMGVSFSARPFQTRTNFFADGVYVLTRSELYPALGVETAVGPLVFRIGTQAVRHNQELSLGMGFLIGSLNMDYAFGLVDRLNARHRVSLGLRFGEKPQPKPEERFNLSDDQPLRFPTRSQP